MLKSAYISKALSESFFESGNIAALKGAKAGCKCNTVLESPPSNSSSSYASTKNAKATLSAPNDGSITYGMYFSLVV